MTDETQAKVEELVHKEYEHGFVTEIDTDTVAPGLNEEVIALISAKKEEPGWLLEWRLDAFRHWTRMTEPGWAHVHYPPIDYQAISYYSAPKARTDGPKSLDEVDPKLLETYEKLGIPLHEQKMLAGVAVDAVFDSVSVATTFKEKLADAGVIFCSFSEAVQNHPDLVREYLGSVVPVADNYYAALNSAVFTDGSFCFIPKHTPLPDGTVHLFPHQRGQYRAVREDPGRCRGRQLRELPGRLHRAHARREPVACGGGGTGGPG